MIYDYEFLCYRVMYRKTSGSVFYEDFSTEKGAFLFVQSLLDRGYHCELLYIQSACL